MSNYKFEIYLIYDFLKNIMLHDLLKFHFYFKLMILFHITFISTLYDIVLTNKYLSIYILQQPVLARISSYIIVGIVDCAPPRNPRYQSEGTTTLKLVGQGPSCSPHRLVSQKEIIYVPLLLSRM